MTDLQERARAGRPGGLDHGPATASGAAVSPDRGWMGEAAETAPRVRAVQPAKSAAQPLHSYLSGLVQRLFIVPDGSDRPVRSIVFAGVDGVRDSGLISAAVAEMLAARVSGATALVDANFQAPSLHRYYGVTNGVGLSDALSTAESIGRYGQQVVSGQRGSLWLFPAGAPVGDGDRLLMAEPSQERLRGLVGAFDHVVIEAPAVAGHRAASLLAAHVDGVVLIAEANVTRRHAVCAAADTLRASGARVLGTVLNNRTFPIPKAVYEQL